MAVAALLLDKSWQRPGALANCTMGEYRSACLVIREGGNGADLFVKSVKEHKTGTKRAARLLLSSTHLPKLKMYVHIVGPIIDPNNSPPK